MTYNTLEAITRSAVRNTLGAGVRKINRLIETHDPDEFIEDEEFNFGTTVELYLDPSISPFKYFSSGATFFVTVLSDQCSGFVSVYLGSSCCDPAAAEAAAADFLERDASDGWYVENEFDENDALGLTRAFSFEPDDHDDMLAKLRQCFEELCDAELHDLIRPFIHYFED